MNKKSNVIVNFLYRLHEEEDGAMNFQSLMVLAVSTSILSSFLYIRDDLLDFSRWRVNFLIELVNQGYDV